MSKNMMLLLPKLTDLDKTVIQHSLVWYDQSKYKNLKQHQIMLVSHKTVISALTQAQERGWWPNILSYTLKKVILDK